MNALIARFEKVSARVQALRERRSVQSPGWFERALSTFAPSVIGASAEQKASIEVIDAELTRVGIHTSADAQLLRDVGVLTGRLKELRDGLGDRAHAALGALESAVSAAEHAFRLGELTPAAVATIVSQHRKLVRIVKVAAIFSGDSRSGLELFPVDSALRSRPVDARLSLGAFLLEQARGEVENTDRKQKLASWAHELMLGIVEVHPNDRALLHRLKIDTAAAARRSTEVPSVRSYAELSRSLRTLAARDSAAAYRAVRALYERAVEANHEVLAGSAAQALRALLPADQRGLRRSVERDALKRQLNVSGEAVGTGTRVASPAAALVSSTPVDALTKELEQLALGLSAEQAELFDLAAGASQYVSADHAFTFEDVVPDETRARPTRRVVSYPTQEMTFDVTGRVDQLPHFVITHPGSIVLDLARGTQLVRRYVVEEEAPKRERVQKSAVRVYVLDASGSMFGARARFRDALLLAELNAIRVKDALGAPFDPLYFSYFNDTPTELIRVDSGRAAAKHIQELLSHTLAGGQTHISLAVRSAFETILRAQGIDRHLSRASVVLVTDGEDGVDVEWVQKAREAISNVHIALSVISLGDENRDLRAFVVNQRAQGAHAFYHHLTDAEIRMARTEFDSTFRTIMPGDIDQVSDAVERLTPLIDLLASYNETPAAPVPSAHDTAPWQFDAVFPELSSAVVREGTSPVESVLRAVAEAVAVAPVELRSAEAVTLLMHLCEVFQLTLTTYGRELKRPTAPMLEAISRIRMLAAPFAHTGANAEGARERSAG